MTVSGWPGFQNLMVQRKAVEFDGTTFEHKGNNWPSGVESENQDSQK